MKSDQREELVRRRFDVPKDERLPFSFAKGAPIAVEKIGSGKIDLDPDESKA